MKQYTLRILFIISALVSLPLAAAAEEGESLQQQELQSAISADIRVTASGKTIHVQNAQGEKLEVFNLTGVCVASLHIDSADKQMTLNVERGIYIVRVGGVSRKVRLS